MKILSFGTHIPCIFHTESKEKPTREESRLPLPYNLENYQEPKNLKVRRIKKVSEVQGRKNARENFIRKCTKTTSAIDEKGTSTTEKTTPKVMEHKTAKNLLLS